MESHKKIIFIGYFLEVIGFILAPLLIIAYIYSFIYARKFSDTLLPYTHFEWQKKTLQWGLVWMLVGIASSPLGIGYFIIFVDVCWYLYRVSKGAYFASQEMTLKI
ncbi:MAG: hypothetical protein QM500_21330 [Methylococcales bacterium]